MISEAMIRQAIHVAIPPEKVGPGAEAMYRQMRKDVITGFQKEKIRRAIIGRGYYFDNKLKMEPDTVSLPPPGHPVFCNGSQHRGQLVFSLPGLTLSHVDYFVTIVFLASEYRDLYFFSLEAD